VDRDDRPRPQQAAQLHRLLGGHAVAQRSGDREPDATEVQQCGVDLHPIRHLTHPAEQHRVVSTDIACAAVRVLHHPLAGVDPAPPRGERGSPDRGIQRAGRV